MEFKKVIGAINLEELAEESNIVDESVGGGSHGRPWPISSFGPRSNMVMICILDY